MQKKLLCVTLLLILSGSSVKVVGTEIACSSESR